MVTLSHTTAVLAARGGSKSSSGWHGMPCQPAWMQLEACQSSW